MSYRRITVTASTIGQSNPAEVEGRKPYRWNGDPGKSEAARIGDGTRKTRPGSGADVNATARQKRLDEFAAALAALGYPDPAKAPDRAVIKAGQQIGVGDRTAKSYRAALRQRQEETADA